jgi:signal peptidase II
MKKPDLTAFKKKLDIELSLIIKIILLAAVIVVLTGGDLIVKEVVNQTLKDRRFDPVVVIEDIWYFRYVENDNLGFSFLRDLDKVLDKTGKWIVMILLQGLGTIIAISFYFYSKEIKYSIPLSMIISGALGNLSERIARGFVIDYIEWYIWFLPKNWALFHPWPIFNLADVYTVIGTLMLVIVMFFFADQAKKDNVPQAD